VITPELAQAFLRSRRSIRRFLSKTVPPEALERILDTATWAPSAHNRQPWRFSVLISEKSKMRLAEAMGADFRRDLAADGRPPDETESIVARSCQRILAAPVAIVLCLDPTLGDIYPDPVRQQAEHLMGVQSVALAGGLLLMAAHAEGLGGVWVCAPLFTPETVRAVLDLPGEWEPQSLLLLGYPAGIPDPRPRKRLSEVVKFL
jgi:F420 biosynthesis protein FbiB-like protein